MTCLIKHASKAEDIYSGSGHDHATQKEQAQVQGVYLAGVIKPDIVLQVDPGPPTIHT